jgi:hypothetical protein
MPSAQRVERSIFMRIDSEKPLTPNRLERDTARRFEERSIIRLHSNFERAVELARMNGGDLHNAVDQWSPE